MPLNWGLSFGVMLGRTSAASASSGRGSVGKKLTGLQGNVLADVILHASIPIGNQKVHKCALEWYTAERQSFGSDTMRY